MRQNGEWIATAISGFPRKSPIAFLATWTMLAAFVGPALAQREGPSAPQLISLSPVAAKPGSEVVLTIQGADLSDVRRLVFGVEGIESIIVYPQLEKLPPSNPGGPRRPAMAAPAVTSSIQAKIKIAANVQTGLVDVRLETDQGVSNPRSLLIRTGEELPEKEPNGDLAEATVLKPGQGMTAAIQGPTDVDYYKIPALKGAKVTLVLRSSSIDSRLIPQMDLFDEKGLRIGKAFKSFENDLVAAILPRSDGPIFARVTSQAYLQGGADCFYHLSHATEPVIQSVFPSVVSLGSTEKIKVLGWNLPGGVDCSEPGRNLEQTDCEVTAPAKIEETFLPRAMRLPRMAFLDATEERLAGPGGISAPFLLGVSREKVVRDNGSNEEWDKAQAIETPCEVAGWFEKRHDRDWYRFPGAKGQILAIDMMGDRLGTNLDLQMAVYRIPVPGQKLGAPILELDDNPEILHPQLFYSRSEDPAPALLTLPADGEYLVRVSHREADLNLGQNLHYRLRLGESRPDFTVIAVPANPVHPDALNIRPGASVAMLLFASRRGGFAGPIQVDCLGLPEGCSAQPVTLLPGQKQGLLIIHAAKPAKAGLARIAFKATGTSSAGEREKDVRTAALEWPHPNPNNNQPIPLLVRLDQGEWLSVRDKPALSPVVEAPSAASRTIAPGGQIEVALKINRSDRFTEACDVTIAGVPGQNLFSIKGVPANRPFTLGAKDSQAKFTVETRGQTPPGIYSLAFRVATSEKEAKKSRTVVDFTEVISVAVVPMRLADATANPAGVRLKPGAKGTIPVSLNRIGGFDGPAQVEIFFADGASQGKSQSIEIPAEQTRGLVPIELSDTLPAGKPVRLTVKTRAKIGSVERVSESKAVLQLTK